METYCAIGSELLTKIRKHCEHIIQLHDAKIDPQSGSQLH